jgi:hypothetical protein
MKTLRIWIIGIAIKRVPQLITAGIQWVGAKWAGTAIATTQEAIGTRPDGLPGPATIAAARRHKTGHPAK